MVQSQMLFSFLFLIPWGNCDKPICGNTVSSHRHQRWYQNAFKSLPAGNFSPHPSHCGFLTPLVCGSELGRCLDVHVMFLSQFSCRQTWPNKESKRSCSIHVCLAHFWKMSTKWGRQGWSELLTHSKSPFEDLFHRVLVISNRVSVYFQMLPSSFPISDPPAHFTVQWRDFFFAISVIHQHLSFAVSWLRCKG